MTRRDFLRSGGCAAALLMASPAWATSKGKQKQRFSDQDVLSQAPARIEKFRKGDGLVAVRNARGFPVPGVRVQIQQVRHDFLFGCNLFQFENCAGSAQEEQYRQRFAALLNFCTLGFYWANYEPQRGRPNYDYTDRVVDWTRAHGITVKGHPLVWDHPASSPRWLPDDQAEIARLSNQRVRDVVARFKDRINVWDVVNEPTHLAEHANKTKMADWGAAIGAVHYVSEPLKISRAANPNSLLLINDYRTDQPYFDILQQEQIRGRPLYDVIGIQSHMHDGVWPLGKVWELCDKYSALNRPIHFTETTLVSGPRLGSGENFGPTNGSGEEQQAEAAVKFYTAVFGHPAVHALTWWDFSDYHAWQRAAAGWLRGDMSPKPVYERLMELIKRQWWTSLTGYTGPRGNYVTRAFYGTYNIRVDLPNGSPVTRQVHWEEGQPNQFVFRV